MRLFPAVVCFLLGGILGCTDHEKSARTLYNQAMTLQQQGDMDKAAETYRYLIKKYPDTEIAVEVNKQLLTGQVVKRLIEPINKDTEVANTLTQQADAQAQAIDQRRIMSALDMYRLNHGKYPTTEQGLQALIRPPLGVARWNGPYLKGDGLADLDGFDYRKEEGNPRYVLTVK